METNINSIKIIENLKQRNLQLDRYSLPVVDEIENVLTLIIWTLCGNMAGYIQYRPDRTKDRKNDEGRGRYYIRYGEGFHVPWGLETFNYRNDILFVVEGIFSAVNFHNLNLPCISVLSNDPKPILNWLSIVRNYRKVFVIPDNDVAGKKLVKYGNPLYLPQEHKDSNDMTTFQFSEWISLCMKDGLLPNHLLDIS